MKQPIIFTNLTGETVERFDSVKDAAEFLGVTGPSIVSARNRNSIVMGKYKVKKEGEDLKTIRKKKVVQTDNFLLNIF